MIRKVARTANFLLLNPSEKENDKGLPDILALSCSSPRWDNSPSGHQRYTLFGLNLGYMYWGQKHSSE